MEAERIREYVPNQDSHLTELVLHIVSQIEQDEKRKRKQIQAQGIATAKARGVRFGAPIKQPENFADLVEQWENKEITVGEILEQTGLSESTFYRRLRELRTIRQDRGKQQ
ncbi:hypothetical protein FACS1894111_06980 [Clostridia bacterium]|nr:hypothetical protein FACS1894111_06980 [Clostridia bacterium]